MSKEVMSLADAPGKQREYETIFILKPETDNENVAKLNDRLKGVIESLEGSVVKVENWGKRRLAYEVKKQLKGIYLHWKYLGSAGLVEELERNLRMLDPVIRYMTVLLATDVDPKERPSEMDDEAYARAAETAADEEDIAIGAVGAETLGDDDRSDSDDDDFDEYGDDIDDSDDSDDSDDVSGDDSDLGDDEDLEN